MKENVMVDTVRTKNGYSCACDLLPGLVVAHTGDFDAFKKEVEDSVRFCIDCAKRDGEAYPAVFDGDYEFVYKFNMQSLLEFYRGIFSFASLETIKAINQKQLVHYTSGISKPRHKQAEKIANGLHRLAKEMMGITV